MMVSALRSLLVAAGGRRKCRPSYPLTWATTLTLNLDRIVR
jgi:hypothetical protein